MTITEARTVQLGDFFEESWGYDQTNVTFYQVVHISPTGKTVKLRRVCARVEEAREYTDLLVPVRDAFRDDLDGIGNARAGLLTRRLRPSSYHGWAVNMTSYSDAYLVGRQAVLADRRAVGPLMLAHAPGMGGQAIACLTLLAVLFVPLLVVNWHKLRDCVRDLMEEIK